MKNTVDRAEYERLRREWGSASAFKADVMKKLDMFCHNCGSTEAVEVHHIVPLKLGGTNRLSNLVVLCHRCHCAAHNGRHMRDYCNKKISGRPHNVTTDELDSAFEDYINGQIGAKECKERVGISKKSKIADMSYYKQYINARGIKGVRNNIDIIRVKRGDVANGDCVGYVEYMDLSTKGLYFGDGK